MIMKKYITIIGGGSSAHVMIPLLSKAGYKINLLTRKPENWKQRITLEYQSETGEVEETLEGSLNIISDDPAEALKDSDYIILCMPVSQYKIALNKIAPFIDKNKKVYVGTIFGQGGFNWMVDAIKEKYALNKVVTFAYCLIPWICQTKTYGETGILYGTKSKNIVAVSPLSEYENLKNTLFADMSDQKTEIYLSENFISLTLSITNQIIHPSRLYGLYLKNPDMWKNKEDVPYFYRDFDDVSAKIFQKLDADYSKVRQAIKSENPQTKFPYLLDYIALEKFYFDSSNEDIKTLFSGSKTLGLIKTPVEKNEDNRWEFIKDHRFFTDDIFYGICIAKYFAEQFSVDVPMIDEILEWAQNLLNVSIIESGKLNKACILNGVEMGTPEKYKGSDIFSE